MLAFVEDHAKAGDSEGSKHQVTSRQRTYTPKMTDLQQNSSSKNKTSGSKSGKHIVESLSVTEKI